MPMVINTKDNSFMEKDKDQENTDIKMAMFIKGYGKMIWRMTTIALLIFLLDLFIKVLLKMENFTDLVN